MVLISETDKAYLAGLIDGEGCISILPGGAGKLQVSVGNNHRGVLEYGQSLFGGSLGGSRVTSSGRVCWIWNLSNKKAAGLLESIFPYLRVKRPQAEVARKFTSTIGLKDIENKRKIPNSIRAARKDMRMKVLALNAGGNL